MLTVLNAFIMVLCGLIHHVKVCQTEIKVYDAWALLIQGMEEGLHYITISFWIIIITVGERKDVSVPESCNVIEHLIMTLKYLLRTILVSLTYSEICAFRDGSSS